MKKRRVSALGVLLILIVLLALANLGMLAAKALAKPARPISGQLLYATAFDNSDDPDWFQYTSALTAKISDGEMRLSVDSVKQGTYSDLNFVFNDFDIRVVAHQLSGDDPQNELGVLFHYQDIKNFYMFSLSADGAYRIFRVVNGGKPEDLSPRQITPFAATGLNHINDLRIVGNGDHFKFYINDQLLALCLKGNDKRATWNDDHSGQCASNNKQTTQELIDTTFPDGKLGLGVFENGSPVTVAFDNLVVYSAPQ